MLPRVHLKNTSRDDIDRIGLWLEDPEVSAMWFGHYSCGDPVHTGYEPRTMLEASDTEWNKVFNNSHRLIVSIYDEKDEHIGESQILLDDSGGAELSLLIGRKEKWHSGYGTASTILLLDKIFKELKLEKAWVRVPASNDAAIGLFEKFGFERDKTQGSCNRDDRENVDTAVMTTNSSRYPIGRSASVNYRNASDAGYPTITITGLVGSGADDIAIAIAENFGIRMIGDEFTETVCRRLKCTNGDLELLARQRGSLLHRLLTAFTVPTDWASGYEQDYYHVAANLDLGHGTLDERITKGHYTKASEAVLRTFALQGNLVIHGSDRNIFIPEPGASLNIFVSASREARVNRIARTNGLDATTIGPSIEKRDAEHVEKIKSLFGSDLLDVNAYDLMLNTDTMSMNRILKTINGAIDGWLSHETGITLDVQDLVIRQ